MEEPLALDNLDEEFVDTSSYMKVRYQPPAGAYDGLNRAQRRRAMAAESRAWRKSVKASRRG